MTVHVSLHTTAPGAGPAARRAAAGRAVVRELRVLPPRPEPAAPALLTLRVARPPCRAWQARDIFAVAEALAELPAELRQLAHARRDVTVQLHAAAEVRYETFAKVMALAQQAGISRLAFVTTAE